MQQRALRVLEFNKIIDMLSSEALCGATADRISELEPSGDVYGVASLLAETTEAQSLLLKKGAPPISPVSDVRPAAARAKSGGILSMRELLLVGHILRIARETRSYLDGEDLALSCPNVSSLCAGMGGNRALEQAISAAILSEEDMADDASPGLLAIRKKIRLLNNKVRDVLNDMIKSPHYAGVLQDAIVTLRGDRFVIPVKSEHKNTVAGVVHDTSSSGATLFVEPMAVVDINNKLRALAGEEKEEIERILAEFSAEVGGNCELLTGDYEAIIALDFIFAKAKLSRKMDAVEPLINGQGRLNLKKARHPLINAKNVVPIDINLGGDFDTLVITGPNTGGKTVTLKTLGLLTLMAQAGLHIPAAPGSEVAVFDNVFADIGDEQSIEQSLSTFSSHMVNIIDILERAGGNDLLLFDELGAGTDPVEGAALAVAILEKARVRGARIAATTHYSEIKLFALSAPGVKNAACEFDVATLKPTYRLLIGVPGKSNAFAISQKLGLPQDVINRASRLVGGESRRFEDVIAVLEENRKKSEEDLKFAEQAKTESLSAKEQAEKESGRIEAQREKLLRDARKEAKSVIARAKKEADEIVAKMRDLRSKNDAKSLEELRGRLKKGIDSLDEKLGEDVFRAGEPIDAQNLRLGQRVFLTTMGQAGTVLALPDKKGRVMIETGAIKIFAHISSLETVREIIKPKRTEYRAPGAPAGKSLNVATEINLLGQTLDEAVINAEKYLDDAVLANLEQVSIIHGKGTGVLRAGIADMLKRHKNVKSFRLGRYGEGETGVTIVELK